MIHTIPSATFLNGTLPMRTARGSVLTPALNVDGLNLIQSQAAKALGLKHATKLLARADEMIEGTAEYPLCANSGQDFLLMQFGIFCLGNKKRHEATADRTVRGYPSQFRNQPYFDTGVSRDPDEILGR